MRKINKHIVHCSASDHGDVEQIRKWHKDRGFDDIGYHYIIYQDGSLHAGRPINIQGAHCRGHNKDSIGTCLIGNNTFTPQQLVTLQTVHDLIKHIYGDNITLHGHREFTNHKTCPNFDVRQFIRS